MANGLLVITGPTAVGKTRMGVLLAERFGGEIISADSMQIYKGMSIGTAAPTEEEMRGVAHHLIGCIPAFENYSVSRYVADASLAADDILSRGLLPIIVGGTGLYIDSLISGTGFVPSDTALRRRLSDEYDSSGGAAMLEKLAEADAESAAKLHPNDKKRIVRALEVYTLTGQTKSEFDRETKLRAPRYNACRIALSYADRADLYARIDARVDDMMRRGLVCEVRRLLEQGVPRSATAMQAIGYKEIAAALDSGLSPEIAVGAIKQASRRYAKRQLTWLARGTGLNWILWKNMPDYESGLAYSTKFVADSGII